jgi:hypothetical protein
MLDLLRHEWLYYRRTFSGLLNGAFTIAGLFLKVYVILNLSIVSYFFPDILNQVDGNLNFHEALRLAVTLYVLVDLLIRYFFQSLPSQTIKPYLTLPVPHQQITGIYYGRLLKSIFNWIPFALCLPLSIRLYSEQPDIATLILGIGIAIGPASLNQSLFLILKLLSNKATKLSIILVLGTGAILLIGYWQVDFIVDLLEQANESYVILSIFLISLFTSALAFRELNKTLNIESQLSSSKSWFTSSKRGIDNWNWLLVEWLFILRTTRPRSMVLMGIVLFVSIIAMFVTRIETNPPTKIYGVIAPVLLSINYGQFLFAWEGTFFRSVHSLPLDINEYVSQKRKLLQFFCIPPTALLLSAAIFFPEYLLLLGSSAIFGIFVTIPFLILTSVFNNKALDNSESSFANYQGTSAIQAITILPLLVFPAVLYFIAEHIGFVSFEILLLIAGIIGFIAQRWITKKTADLLAYRKYRMIENFKKN